jgi:hypothetical protein
MITTGLTVSAKMLLLDYLAKESLKLALYTGVADIGPETTAYTTAGEVVGRGYKPGGVPLKGGRVWEDRGSACLTWDSPVIPVSTISANGFMIYCPNRGNKAIFVGSWNATYTSTEGPFTVNISADQICID